MSEQFSGANGRAASTPPTIVRYEAVALPRGNVVVEQPSKRLEAGGGDWSIEEARAHAAQLNAWLERRPSGDRRYRLFVPPPEPTEAELVELLERMLEPERKAVEAVRALARLSPVEAVRLVFEPPALFRGEAAA